MEIGTNVDSWCSRCKLQLRHTIEAVVDGKIKRVHCNTCRAQHAYRAGPPGTRAGGTRVGSSRGGSRSAANGGPMSEYQSLLRGRPASAARLYAVTAPARWKVGELLSHATFGLGAVTAERDNKIDVLFPDGPRVLVHGR